MPPRGFTNPAPKTESARSALNSFTCTLCNKSYSRHPEYEAHIGSYDHQHKKRLRDLKQLSRDPNAAEKARKAERKANEEAGLIVVGSAGKSSSGGGGGAASGFKKGGFKSSFSVVAGGGAGGANAATSTAAPRLKKNVLGDEDEDEDEGRKGAASAVDEKASALPRVGSKAPLDGERRENEEVESDTDEEYGNDDLETGGGYYDPRRPTDCFPQCAGAKVPAS
ncbi:C2H2 type zinc finger domain-containing protein [Arthroderma uncinatum]|uniref:C2H2 type zinc finger domain-containing protein n=1 Tax=Arthroderma uncinatum TaxID=74035 RepID=UPI00144AA58D|nr:C2H2 type zinc finger domain-containing protein [Arthroderma uncinatum]KAF3480984.1 C2H2 type zinc finger domain-containing protein [Arthroderma uncinatum]